MYTVHVLEVDRRAAEDARRAAEAARAEAKYEAYKEGVAAGSCLSRVQGGCSARCRSGEGCGER